MFFRLHDISNNDDLDALQQQHEVKLEEQRVLLKECKRMTMELTSVNDKLEMDDWCTQGCKIWDTYRDMMWPLLTGKVGPDSTIQVSLIVGKSNTHAHTFSLSLSLRSCVFCQGRHDW